MPVPAQLAMGRRAARASTQEAFGRIMGELARDEGELGARIITTSPDVTVSTSLGAWVGRRSVFNRADHADVFKAQKVASSQLWAESRRGQHVELGIAENNLFLMLAALGLAGPLFGQRLLPVGTLYDPFIARGLDALTYASYQDARFLLVATPSGITLAPEGGAHQSVATNLIGIGQPGLLSYEPTYADELAVIMRFAFEHLQAADGESIYLRLSTRPIDQPEREMSDDLAAAILAGAYWLREPAPGSELALVGSGAVLPEVLDAADQLADDLPGLGVMVVTSADRLHVDWRAGQSGERRGRGGAGPPARAARPGRAPDHRARRPSGDARLARQRFRTADLSARRRPLRPVGRHPGPLSRLRARCGGDHRPRRARLPGPAAAAMSGAPQGAVLSIQSAVACGHVGNSAATLPLQRLGFDVLAVNTVQLAHHPGHGRWRGHKVAPAAIAEIVGGLEEHGALGDCVAVLSGYLGDSAVADVVLRAVAAVRAARPDALYHVRSGDRRRPQRGVRRRRDPRAHARRPGAARRCRDAEPLRARGAHGAGGGRSRERARGGSRAACARPAPRGRDGLPLPERPDALAVLAAGQDQAWLVTTPRRPVAFGGTGDAFSALFLGHYLQSGEVAVALERAVAAVYALVEQGCASGARELPLVALQDQFALPVVRFAAAPIGPRGD